MQFVPLCGAAPAAVYLHYCSGTAQLQPQRDSKRSIPAKGNAARTPSQRQELISGLNAAPPDFQAEHWPKPANTTQPPANSSPQRLELVGGLLAAHHIDGLDAAVLGQLCRARRGQWLDRSDLLNVWLLPKTRGVRKVAGMPLAESSTPAAASQLPSSVAVHRRHPPG